MYVLIGKPNKTNERLAIIDIVLDALLQILDERNIVTRSEIQERILKITEPDENQE